MYIRNPIPYLGGGASGEIQHGRIRRDWGEVRHELHEGLSESYYNTVKYGVPTDVIVYGVKIRIQGQDLRMDSLSKFQEYTQVLYWLDIIMNHLLNIQHPQPIPAPDYDWIYDENGNFVGLYTTGAKIGIQAWINVSNFNRLMSTRLFNFLEQNILAQKGKTINIQAWLDTP